MRRLLLAGLAATGVIATTPTAQAHNFFHYYGTCGFFTISDGTDSPQTKWDGEIHAAAVATSRFTGLPALVPIEIDCELRINGAVPGTPVFHASIPGIGVAAGTGQFSFNADPDDIVTMCHIVTVDGEGAMNGHKDCGGATTIPIVPEPIQDATEQAERIVDQAICGTIASMSGGPADQPPTFDMRSDGDIYIDGAWFWDCPPYGTSGS